MGVELALFMVLGLTAIMAAAGMIIVKNAVHSALLLILNFGCVAILYLMLNAPFISMVQITVYTGAIMVLFLFVIMLLGAEQTSDTSSRSFRWVTLAATGLTTLFVFALAIPFVMSGGMDLPDAPGNDPMLRVVHAANVTEPVAVTISGDALDEPVVLADVSFADATDFMTLPVGDYDISITQADAAVYEATVSLEANAVITAVAYGADSGELDVALVANSIGDSGNNAARVVVFNGYSTDDLLLVDKGSNRVLDTESDGTITDRILADGVAYGQAAEAFTLDEGDYALAFYRLDDGEAVLVANLSEYVVEGGTEQMALLTADYAATPDLDGNYRARVLYRDDDTLSIDTAEVFGSPGDIGQQLFTTYLLPVNLVGFLLLVALIGVIVLTRPEGLTGEKRSTRNRRRKVSRPLVSVISQQTGRDVVVDTPKLDAGE